MPPDYPPTPPIRLPLLGHMHYIVPYVLRGSMTKTTRATGLEDLNKRYGKGGILCLHFGPFKLVLIGKRSSRCIIVLL